MGMRTAEQHGSFDANRPIAERGTFRRAGDYSDMPGHGELYKEAAGVTTAAGAMLIA